MILLGWVGRLFRRRTPERCIFRFFDGSGRRAADPLEVWRAMEDKAGTEWPELIRLLAAEPTPGVVGAMAARHEANQRKAADTLAEAACVAFGVMPLTADGRAGLIRSERVALVATFLRYMGGLADRATFPGGPGRRRGDAAEPDVPGTGGPVDAASPHPAPAGA